MILQNPRTPSATAFESLLTSSKIHGPLNSSTFQRAKQKKGGIRFTLQILKQMSNKSSSNSVVPVT